MFSRRFPWHPQGALVSPDPLRWEWGQGTGQTEGVALDRLLFRVREGSRPALDHLNSLSGSLGTSNGSRRVYGSRLECSSPDIIDCRWIPINLRIVPRLLAGLLWLVFFSSFILVLFSQPPLLYVMWALTALGIFYLAFEARRLRHNPDPNQRRARTIIRIGFALVTATALVSLLVDLLILGNGVSQIRIVSSIIESMWICGTLVAFGGVLYTRSGKFGSRRT